MIPKPREWLGLLFFVSCVSCVIGYAARGSIFEANRKYSFKYVSQVATGISLNANYAENSEVAQRALTTLRAKVHLKLRPYPNSNDPRTFAVIMELSKPQFGTANQRLPPNYNDRSVFPWAIYSQNDIDQSVWNQLLLPVTFRYSEGEVTDLRFDDRDETWSKNLKRGVINLLQLHLRGSAERTQSGEYQYVPAQEQKTAHDVFSLKEHSVEGICQTTYTVQKSEEQLDVKKTVDYNQCDLLSDNVFGFDSSHSARQCALCSMEASPYVSGLNNDYQYDPCMHTCAYGHFDGVERTTSARYTLAGDIDEYGIDQAEILSTYRFTSPETSFRNQVESSEQTQGNFSGPVDSFLHSTAISRLIFQGSDSLEEQVVVLGSDRGQGLIYDNTDYIRKKRYYMYGDKEIRPSPIFTMKHKVERAEEKLRYIIKETTHNKVSSNAATHIQELVELLRKCNESEIESIYTVTSVNLQLNNPSQKEPLRNASTQSIIEQGILDGFLASAATRNSLAVLARRMKNGKIESLKTITVLKLFSMSIHSPSDEQVSTLLELCQSQIMKNPISKGTCWLAAGALIGRVCQPTPRSIRITLGNGQKVCSFAKRQQYKEALAKNFDETKDIYDKILALKAIGNAGLTETAAKIDSVINNQSATIIRVTAIDALRRIHIRNPELVRKMVFPIFRNISESEEVRIAAFWQLINAAGRVEDKPWLLEEIGTVLKEEQSKSPEVFSFVYTALQTMSELKESSMQKIAKQIRTLLESIEVDLPKLASSSLYSIPLTKSFSSFLNLATVFPRESSMFPSQVVIGLGTSPFDNPTENFFATGHSLPNQIQLGISLHDINGWFEKVMSEMAGGNGTSSNNGQAKWENTSLQELKKIMARIRPSKRNSQTISGVSPLALMTARLGDVDELAIPLVDGKLFGLPPSFKELITSVLQKENGQYIFKLNMMGTVGEKWAYIPTTAGIPIKVIHSLPTIATSNEKLHTESDGKNIRVHVENGFSATHLHRMEVALPKITATGSESIQSFENTLPPIEIGFDDLRSPQGKVDAEGEEGYQITIGIPAGHALRKTTLFAVHCFPVTYVRDWNPRMLAHGSINFNTVHFPEFENQYRAINMREIGKEWGIPISVKGHFHAPSIQQMGKLREILQMWGATENHVRVMLEPFSKGSPSTSDEEKQQKQVQLKFSVRGHAFRQKSREAITNTFAKLAESFYDHWSQLSVEQAKSGRNLQSELKAKFEDIKNRDQLFEQVVETRFEMNRVKTNRILGQKSTEKIGVSCQSSIKLECDMASQSYCRISAKAQSKAKKGVRLSFKGFVVLPDEVDSIEDLVSARIARNKFLNLIYMIEAKVKLIAEENAESNENARNDGNVQAQWGGRIRVHGESSQLASINDTSEIMTPVVINKISSKIDQMDSMSMYNLMVALNDYYRIYKDGMVAEDKFDINHTPKLAINEAEILLVVDPFTQRHADMVVWAAATPIQMQATTTQFSSIHWPKHLQLVELLPSLNNSDIQIPQADTGSTSINSFLRQMGVRARPLCWVDGNDLRSFDEVIYQSPFSTCYTVVAADCADNALIEEQQSRATEDNDAKPRFVVMLKRIGQSKENPRHALKLITHQWTIEAERGAISEPGRKAPLAVTLNGMSMSSDFSQESSAFSFMDLEKSQMRIHTPDVDVIFDGKRVWIRASNEYKDQMCGLCAHNGKSNLKRKHRQLTVECDGEELSSFYSDAKIEPKEEKRAHIRRRDEDDHTETRFSIIDPVPKTRVKESGDQICFTLSPVSSCPEHSTIFIKITIDMNAPSKVTRDETTQKVNAAFGCLERTEPDAIRLRKDAQNEDIDEQEKQWMTNRLAQLSPSLSEEVTVPNKCLRFNHDFGGPF